MTDPRQPIFDTIRAISLRAPNPLNETDVATINHELDALGAAKGPAGASQPVPVPPPSSAPPAADAASTGLRDEEAFYKSLRASGGLFAGGLTQQQVDGITALLAATGKAGWGVGWAANAFATSYLETNQTMAPVKEAYWLSEDWRKNNLKYYPWYGRGLVQLTWEDNYKKADTELSLGGTLIAKPDRALELPIASDVMVRGMSEGWFTGKKLGDYIPAGQPGNADQHKNARKIINGTDRWEDLSAYAMKFQAALQAGGWR